MRRRAFTLVEILAVIAILAVLAALLFPVFARSRERAKVSECQSRLHQVALATQMYRTDHDGQVWMEISDSRGGRTTAGGYRFPWNNWLPIEPYLKDGALVWCPLPNRGNDPISIHNLYHPRLISKPALATNGTTIVRHAFEPEPGRVVAFCGNHTTTELLLRLPSRSGGMDLFKGDYPFVREDGSAGVAKSTQIGLSYLYPEGVWRDEPSPKEYTSQAFRFPGEPWPPSLPAL